MEAGGPRQSREHGEERYRVIFENSPVAMWEEDFSAILARIESWKTSGINDIRAHLTNHPELVAECVRLVRVLDVNRAARDFYGVRDKDELLNGLPELFDAQAYEVFREEIAALAEEKGEFAAELPLSNARGERRVVDMRVCLVPGAEPAWSLVIVSFLDITERKRLEERLFQAQRLEGIGRLAGGVAHDFNNLLMVINGYTELMLPMLDERDPLRAGLVEVRRAGARAQALTQQLLAFGRKQILVPRTLDLNALVADAEETIRRVAGERIQVETALDGNLGLVNADPAHLEQALMNLVMNARDAMPEGGTLTIRTTNVDLDGTEEVAPAGQYVLLTVGDTGAGLDAGTMRRLFEPFFTTKELGKGTGLGLATVFGTVKQSGGEIRGYGEPGRGATFEIYLPRLERAARPEPVGRPKADKAPAERTILVAEDQDGVRKLVRDILAQEGYRVLEAADGAEALGLCERHGGPIHLLVTDLIMPEMTGWEVAERARARRPQLKVLYVSGYSGSEIPEGSGTKGSYEFMQKPFSPQALANKVRELLE